MPVHFSTLFYRSGASIYLFKAISNPGVGVWRKISTDSRRLHYMEETAPWYLVRERADGDELLVLRLSNSGRAAPLPVNLLTAIQGSSELMLLEPM